MSVKKINIKYNKYYVPFLFGYPILFQGIHQYINILIVPLASAWVDFLPYIFVKVIISLVVVFFLSTLLAIPLYFGLRKHYFLRAPIDIVDHLIAEEEEPLNNSWLSKFILYFSIWLRVAFGISIIYSILDVLNIFG